MTTPLHRNMFQMSFSRPICVNMRALHVNNIHYILWYVFHVCHTCVNEIGSKLIELNPLLLLALYHHPLSSSYSSGVQWPLQLRSSFLSVTIPQIVIVGLYVTTILRL